MFSRSEVGLVGQADAVHRAAAPPGRRRACAGRTLPRKTDRRGCPAPISVNTANAGKPPLSSSSEETATTGARAGCGGLPLCGGRPRSAAGHKNSIPVCLSRICIGRFECLGGCQGDVETAAGGRQGRFRQACGPLGAVSAQDCMPAATGADRNVLHTTGFWRGATSCLTGPQSGRQARKPSPDVLGAGRAARWTWPRGSLAATTSASSAGTTGVAGLHHRTASAGRRAAHPLDTG